MFPILWTLDNETTPYNVLKARVYLEVSPSKTGMNKISVTTHYPYGVVDAYDSRFTVNPFKSYQPSPTPSIFPFDFSWPFRPKTAFEPCIVRKEGDDDEIWQLQFNYNFLIKYSSSKHVPDRFRGYVAVRSTVFGAFEPVSITSFVEGSVSTATSFESATNTLIHSCTLPEIRVDLPSHRLNKQLESNAHPEQRLATLLFLEFLPYNSVLPNTPLKGNDLQIKADVSSMNFQMEEETDAALRVNHAVLYCHSEKIIKVSSLLRPLFDRDDESDDSDNPYPSTRIIKDMSPYFSSSDGIRAFLRYVYFNEMPTTEILGVDSLKRLFELLKFAHMFDIKPLKEFIQRSFADIHRYCGFSRTLKLELEVYTFAKSDESLKCLRKKVLAVLRKRVLTFDKTQLEEFTKSHPEASAEILEPEFPNSSEPPVKKQKLLMSIELLTKPTWH